ncbi:hypothetical protein DIPPA_25094 [Diplonema papillatum]|nr:hypothetical protein DIPPA_25094 [Diplonema papillatum]
MPAQTKRGAGDIGSDGPVAKKAAPKKQIRAVPPSVAPKAVSSAGSDSDSDGYETEATSAGSDSDSDSTSVDA